MRITKQQLRRLIRETLQLEKMDMNPCSKAPPNPISEEEEEETRAEGEELREAWAGTQDPLTKRGGPWGTREWKKWGSTFDLSPEYDNDGQLIFYLSHDQPDRAAIAAEALKAGADVDTDNDGNDMIYTGFTDEGPMYTDEDHAAAEEILATRAGGYSGTTLPGGKRI